MFIDLRERGMRRGKDRVRAKHQSVASPKYPDPGRDRSCNLGMCPDWELNLHPFGARDDAPTT